ncbi:MAG: MarR family transcriptional regulator [Natronomonas sp.]
MRDEHVHRPRDGNRSGTGPMPRALIHKRILDEATERPEASMEELADEISGASATLVERVLEEYGDPATSKGDGAESGLPDTHDEASSIPESSESHDPANKPIETTAMSESNIDSNETTGAATVDSTQDESPHEDEPTADAGTTVSGGSDAGTSEVKRTTAERSGTKTTDLDEDEPDVPSRADLSAKQRTVLRKIYDDPEATQVDLADEIGVSRATISQRVNAVDGFEWPDRAAFVERLFDDSPETSESTVDPESEAQELTDESPTSKYEPGDAGIDSGDTTRKLEALNTEFDRLETALEGLTERFESLERSVQGADCPGHEVFYDPELVGKIVRECVESDRFTEDEEVRIIAGLLESGRGTS